MAFFRLGIAACVLPLGWLSARSEAASGEAPRSPFPLHVPALVGLRTVLWLFRLVGMLWLAQGSLHVAQRVAQRERSAASGSSFVARRAATRQATKATAPSSSGTDASVTGSLPLTP